MATDTRLPILDEPPLADQVPADAAATIGPELLIPSLLRAHPEARAVLDRYGLRGCGGPLGPRESLGYFARVHGVELTGLLRELDEVVATAPGACCSQCAAASAAANAGPPALADALYRRFFLAGIALVLTAGATWGAWMLWRIGLRGQMQVNPIQSINAHGMVQISGWVGLFIMGFAYQAFPRIWHTTLAAPRVAVAVFVAMLVGIAAQAGGMIAPALGPAAVPIALAGAWIQAAAVLAFAAQIGLTFARSRARFEPYVAFVVTALGWFVASAAMSAWHTGTTLRAADEATLVWLVATYQAPLRDLQVHGLALFMILGVSLRMLPALFGVPAIAPRRAWWGFGLLVVAVLGEVALFLAYRLSGRHALAAALLVPWTLLAAGVATLVGPWRPWAPFPVPDRVGKFVRAAYGWLAVSLVMLLLLPLHVRLGGQAFSHAYYGAIRHAITVGFVSLMIMGFAAKVVPTLTGADPARLSKLRGPFLLVNAGCLLRVSLQTLTDWWAWPYPWIGLSGTLEVLGLAWWGAGIARLIVFGPGLESDAIPAASEAPARIDAADRPADVLDWYPETAAVFERFGLTPLRHEALRRTMGRSVTLAQAARLRGLPLPDLLGALNAAGPGSRSAPR